MPDLNTDEVKPVAWEWLGERIPYPELEVRGDTFPITWADDGELYTSAGDPIWGPVEYAFGPWIGGNSWQNATTQAYSDPSMTGLDVEKISGLPPNHAIEKVNVMPNCNGIGGWGPKPSGMISVKGVLYLAAQNLLGYRPPAYGHCQHGSDAFIMRSADHGKTWSHDHLAEWELRRLALMFPGRKFGGPSFVQFGRDNSDAVDEYVYAISTDQWDNGTELRLGRVPQDRILEASAWQWVCGFASHTPFWSADLEASIPILSIGRSIGLPEMVYLPHLKRYLLLTWRLHEDFCSDKGSDLFIFASPNVWGPFRLAHCDTDWESSEVNPYCPRLPLKWFDPGANQGWLLFSGSWRFKSPYYRSHVRPFRLNLR
jgi:hypothetical protein